MRTAYASTGRRRRTVTVTTTVVEPSFPALPIVLLTGESETGKTRTVEILSELAFNGRLRGDLTAAVFARQIQRDQPLICIDESEDLGRRQELVRLLRLMYRSSGTREVSTPQGTSAVFLLFAPAILVNIRGVDDALQSRMIELQTVPRVRPVERFLLHQQGESLQRLRDDLYRFACAYAPAIYDAFLTLPPVPGVTDRVEELWGPIFGLCRVIDGTAEASSDPPLLDEMVGLAHDLGLRKQEHDRFTSRAHWIVAGLSYFLKDREPLEDTAVDVNAEALTRFIRAAEGLDRLRIEEVARVLNRNKINVKTFRHRVHLPNGSTNPLTHYTIDVVRLREQLAAWGMGPAR